MRLYIAGPMSGIQSFNIPAFDALAADLRAAGHDVVSPAELDGPVTRDVLMASETGTHADLPEGETWGYYLSRDVKMLADDGIEGVVVLPGFAGSAGARLETFTANQILGLPIFIRCPKTGDLRVVPQHALERAWIGGPDGR